MDIVPEHFAPGVRAGVDGVAQAVDEAAAVKGILIQNFGQIIGHAALVIPVLHMGLDVGHHLHDLAVGAAVAGALQGSHGRRNGRIGVRAGGGDDVVGEGGVVAAAVVGVEHKRHVQGPGFQFRVAAVLPQQPQEVFGSAELRLGHMDEQALARQAVPPRLIGVDGQHRHVGGELEALTQHVLQADVVGLVVVAEQRQDGPLHGVHQVSGGRLHNNVPEEVGGQGPVGCQLHAEVLELLRRGQFAEQQQIGRLLKGEPAPLGGALDDLPAVDAAVVQDTVGRRDVLTVGGVGDHVVGLDFRHAGQAGQNAPSILVTQAPLYIVFLVETGVDEVLFLPLFLQCQDSGRDLTVSVFPVFFPDHSAVSFHPWLVILQF